MRLGIAALIAGYVLDLLLGDPEWLYHPVRLIGKYISFAEKRLRKRGGNLRRSALILTGSTILLTMAAAAGGTRPAVHRYGADGLDGHCRNLHGKGSPGRGESPEKGH